MKTPLNLFIITLFFQVTVWGQKIDQQFFQQTDAFFKTHVKDGLINYSTIKSDPQLPQLIRTVETATISGLDGDTRKAFLINAYNLQVINKAIQAYPIASVQSVPGFFDRKKVTIAGEQMTLNQLEKEQLLKPYGDARLHFVLVCGALGCPPITDFAYQPGLLESQLDQQTKAALDDPNFLSIDGTTINLSQIFKWYVSDFGGNKNGVFEFINQHRTYNIPTNAKVNYYEYDWNLNEVGVNIGSIGANNSVGNNAARYVVSSTIAQGTYEFKIFNNLYTQRTGSNEVLTDRATFFTTTLSAIYGLSNRFNIGINARYRRVRNESLPNSALKVFSSTDEGSARQGLTAIGPQIRYAPVPKWQNFSIQSSFVFPIGTDLAGNASQPFIDWNGATWNTQIFNDFAIGNSFSLFTELDFLLEDIGSGDRHLNRFSTPVTLIFSYNLNPKTILYVLSNYSPFWQSNFDYFLQGGIGGKYQFTPNVELELLVSDFTNQFLSNTGGQAATFNIGFRFNL